MNRDGSGLVLALNCGSSTLKFLLARASGELVERGTIEVSGDGEALSGVIGSLRERGLLSSLAAVGHRVVHGGVHFREAELIDGDVLAEIEAVSELAPLHNAPALQVMRRCRELLGGNVPMVAVFDTSFHRTMPERASLYAIDPELARKHAVYRYGFHGLAHRSMLGRYEELSGRTAGDSRLITLQLGAGCSVTAIDSGRSLDTSMGFTPLEGLVMATRSGDIDPSVVSYLSEREGITQDDVLSRLNHESGLLGVSGISSDMRELLAAEAGGDERARLAVGMFCYRARKYVGAYLAALGGADAVVFGGGIGQHSSEVRERICEGLGWAGLHLDPERNAVLSDAEGAISADSSTIAVYVAQVDEERIIVADTLEVLARSREP